jgi:DNA-directed RNA polymerase subunit RPC12/RpoP
MENKEGYACKECGAKVTIKDDGTLQRSCEHKGTVITELKATVKGISRVAQR